MADYTVWDARSYINPADVSYGDFVVTEDDYMQEVLPVQGTILTQKDADDRGNLPADLYDDRGNMNPQYTRDFHGNIMQSSQGNLPGQYTLGPQTPIDNSGDPHGGLANEPMTDQERMWLDFQNALASQQEQYQAAMAAYQAEQIRMQQMAELEGLWGQRSAAENQAIEDVTTLLSEQGSYAAMTGQDFNMTDEAVDAMTANLFADYWPEEIESSVQGLIGELGVGGQFKSNVQRGTEGTFDTLKGSIAELQRLQEQSGKGASVLTDEEETLEQATVLGG